MRHYIAAALAALAAAALFKIAYFEWATVPHTLEEFVVLLAGAAAAGGSGLFLAHDERHKGDAA